jgi:NAD(P)-dependent dehydrogenase (short-subunit alcohol dehydrogenase family)
MSKKFITPFVATITLAALLIMPKLNLAEEQKAVLITGASSGIGLRTAEHLSANGFFVYAGARKQKDLDALNKIPNVEAVRLDVTMDEDIAAAVQQVSKGGRGLDGVVNNAGVAIVGPLTEVAEDDLHFQMNVNVFGPYRITKAFAPMLRESSGRVVNISSISGILSAALLGPYSMSKHALEAYNDSLAAEMVAQGVHVAAIEPGNFDSKIGESVDRRMKDKGASFEGSAFEEQAEGLRKRLADRSGMADPIAIARAVEHALSSEKPQARYMVVPNQREAEVTINKMLQEMVELNQNHPYSYDRDTLVKMLDAKLAGLQLDSGE